MGMPNRPPTVGIQRAKRRVASGGYGASKISAHSGPTTSTSVATRTSASYSTRSAGPGFFSSSLFGFPPNKVAAGTMAIFGFMAWGCMIGFMLHMKLAEFTAGPSGYVVTSWRKEQWGLCAAGEFVVLLIALYGLQRFMTAAREDGQQGALRDFGFGENIKQMIGFWGSMLFGDYPSKSGPTAVTIFGLATAGGTGGWLVYKAFIEVSMWSHGATAYMPDPWIWQNWLIIGLFALGFFFWGIGSYWKFYIALRLEGGMRALRKFRMGDTENDDGSLPRMRPGWRL